MKLQPETPVYIVHNNSGDSIICPLGSFLKNPNWGNTDVYTDQEEAKNRSKEIKQLKTEATLRAELKQLIDNAPLSDLNYLKASLANLEELKNETVTWSQHLANLGLKLRDLTSGNSV